LEPSFQINGFAFFELQEHEKNVLLNNLLQTCGVFEIPASIWQTKLINLPSPIKSSYCSACYTTGPIPTTTASFTDTLLDVIVKEKNPKRFEPDYNVYRHFILKNSDAKFYISEPVKPDHHWAVRGVLKKIYGFK